ncbi:YitT family protein [Desulfoferrobacter suflitae]|uniref:YitT family protein n=1 Tax=Desulfoferrobacter suflitae TaxID=2865782 RepID=UPI0021649C3E|nr:YitT family protein [Desulfoferrobacter suflitae]MCK8601286.1 YitT family protein [Desulfoferrobacter suflitae]
MSAVRLYKPFERMFKGFSIRSILVNCGLIIAGSIIFVTGMNSVLVPQKLLSGGLVGISLIVHYLIPSLDVGLVYFVSNIPLLLLGWLHVSRRFMLYTIFGMAFFSLVANLIRPPAVDIQDPMLAALFAGVICGVGGGVILRSLGSAGGLDILAVYTNKRWGLRPGIVIMASNALVLLAGALYFNIELALHSLIFVYTSSRVIDVILTGFNRRKALLIVSKESHKIADDILFRINRGVTYLKGKGGYTGEDSDVIFTVTTLTELPRMKDIVYGIDPEAFMVVNDTLEVLGKRHGTRRVY